MSGLAPAVAGKVLYLESLRGLAALIVAIHHYNVGTVLSDDNFIGNGWLMVDFFFVLSGFVIALNYQRQISSFRSLAVFQTRRFLRLYPLHLLMLFVFLGIELAKLFAQLRFGLVADKPPFAVNDGTTFIHNLLLTQSFFNEGVAWNGPSWSISAEFYTYLLFGILVLCLRRDWRWIVAGSAVLSLAGFAYLARYEFDSHVMRCLYSFFIGVIVWNLSQVVPGRVRASLVHALVIAVVIALYAVSWPDWEPVSTVMPLVFGALILSLVASPADIAVKRLLEKQALVHLGAISYGVYMIHAAVWWVLHQAIRLGTHASQGLTAEGRSIIVVGNPLISWGGLIVGLASILWLAHLSYRKVEMPINDLRHALGSKSPVAGSRRTDQ